MKNKNNDAYLIASVLKKNGFEAFYAGGCVRDFLLKKQPKDYDIATSAIPDEIEKLFDRTNSIGKKFGTIGVLINESLIEVTTFRSDETYFDGRHPTNITFTSAEKDVERRDFTINGLFMNPDTFEIIDFVNGQDDLKKRTVKAIGDPDHRFSEDHLRMLRAVRFAHTLDFDLDPETLRSIKKNAHKISVVSVERIENELSRILIESQKPGDALQTLHDIGLLEYILPEVEKLIGVEQPPDHHPEGDVFTHVKLMLNLSKTSEISPNFSKRELVYSILFHDISKPEMYMEEKQENGTIRIRFVGHEKKGAEVAKEILNRLKIPTKEKNKIVDVIANHMLPFQSQQMLLSTLKKLIGSPTFDLLLELHRIDGLGSKGLLDSYKFLSKKREEFSNKNILPKHLISGNDLKNIGIGEGLEIKKILNEVYELQLNEIISSYDEAINWVKQQYC